MIKVSMNYLTYTVLRLLRLIRSNIMFGGTLQKQIRTIKDILVRTSAYFKGKKIDAPRITSELLLGKALNLSREKLYINYDKPLTQRQLAELDSYIQRTACGEPVQYITGYQQFWSLDFKVTPDVLIPRADTETLVEAVVNDVKNDRRKSVNILEIGTGSGAVCVAIAHELKSATGLYIKAVDISKKALEIATENAAINDVGDTIDKKISAMFSEINISEHYDIIVSNPPYISKDYYDMLESKVKDYEPKTALYGGEDGLAFYKDIFSTSHNH